MLTLMTFCLLSKHFCNMYCDWCSCLLISVLKILQRPQLFHKNHQNKRKLILATETAYAIMPYIPSGIVRDTPPSHLVKRLVSVDFSMGIPA